MNSPNSKTKMYLYCLDNYSTNVYKEKTSILYIDQPSRIDFFSRNFKYYMDTEKGLHEFLAMQFFSSPEYS